MYCVYVASVAGTEKVNIELTFAAPPSVAQVISRATAAFARLFTLRGYKTEFAVSFAMIFDDATLRWAPLERSTQLTHNCQVYVFQPDCVDVPGEIPDPISATQLLADYESPSRHSAVDLSPRPALPASYSPRSTFTHPSPAELALESERRRRVLAEYRDIPGDSIIREERTKEEQKITLPLDAHRDTVRRETQSFLEGQWSPSRRQ